MIKTIFDINCGNSNVFTSTKKWRINTCYRWSFFKTLILASYKILVMYYIKKLIMWNKTISYFKKYTSLKLYFIQIFISNLPEMFWCSAVKHKNPKNKISQLISFYQFFYICLLFYISNWYSWRISYAILNTANIIFCHI